MNESTTTKRIRARPPAVKAESSFNSLQSLETFQEANANIFPSMGSLRWFCRQHRDELLMAGAVIEIAGRIQVDAKVFSQEAIEIGRRASAARHQR